MRRLFQHANYDFIGRRKLAYMITLVALVIAVGAMALNRASIGRWLNYGVDFTGGTLLHIRAPGANEGDLRAIADGTIPGSTISRFGGSDEFQVRTPSARGETTEATTDALVAAIRARYPQMELRSTDAVGAKVGDELQTRALIAIIVSLGATLIYLAFRFEWRFGVAAVIATAHDIMLTLGLIAVLRMEVSLTTVAALLTIVGYSLNDTIVIFDRIRENLRTGKRQEFIPLLNRSINETLPRTVLTGTTTLMTLLCLAVFGGVVVRDFAFILMVGILLGTYSSIFVASPVLLEIEKKFPHETKQVRKPRSPVGRPSRVGAASMIRQSGVAA
jgi:preprotein translocase subunit SecF